MMAEQDKKNAAFYYSVNMLRLLLRAKLLTEAEYKKIVKLSAEHGTINGTINGTIKLSETATIVYELMKEDVKVTKSQLSQKAGKSIRTISRAIDELKNNGLLLGRTSNKNGEWILSK